MRTFTGDEIFAFHSKRNYNSKRFGYFMIECEGEETIGEIAKRYADELFEPDSDGTNAQYTKDNGNGVGLTNAMVDSGIGFINFDEEYNTFYTLRLKNISDESEELAALLDYFGDDSDELLSYLKQKFEEDKILYEKRKKEYEKKKEKEIKEICVSSGVESIDEIQLYFSNLIKKNRISILKNIENQNLTNKEKRKRLCRASRRAKNSLMKKYNLSNDDFFKIRLFFEEKRRKENELGR